MIPRYSRPEMVAIWSPATRFRIWFEIEAHAADAQAALGVIPKAAAEAVWKAKDAEFDVDRIDEIEAVTNHPARTAGLNRVRIVWSFRGPATCHSAHQRGQSAKS
jgi:adenylosuccinate lyase